MFISIQLPKEDMLLFECTCPGGLAMLRCGGTLIKGWDLQKKWEGLEGVPPWQGSSSSCETVERRPAHMLGLYVATSFLLHFVVLKPGISSHAVPCCLDFAVIRIVRQCHILCFNNIKLIFSIIALIVLFLFLISTSAQH